MAVVRIEGTEEWMQVRVADLSLGGTFVLTDRFMAEGTRVDVGLAFPSGIRLFFVADVARVVPDGPRGPGGLGLQFLPSTPENERALKRELEPRMEAVPPPAAGAPGVSGPAAGGPPSGASSTSELTISIYERLRLPPDCDALVLGQALERLIASLELSLEAMPAGNQRDQARVFKQSLERIRPICQDPMKRVAYDFNHGYVRAEERIAAAALGKGPPLSKLQEVWKRIFPDDVREARQLLAEARKGGPDAAQLLARARSLDPFNPQLQAPVASPPPAPPPAPPPVVSPPAAFAPPQPPPAAVAPPAPAVSPNPFGSPPSAPLAQPPPVPPATGASAPVLDDDDLPLVEPDDFFGGLED